MYCKKCGKLIADDSSFCYSCGEKVDVKNDESCSDENYRNDQDSVLREFSDSINIQKTTNDGKLKDTRRDNTLVRDCLIGHKRYYYIKEFEKIEKGEKSKFSWVGFVFAFWALYRKMYIELFIYLVLNTLLLIANFVVIKYLLLGTIDIITGNLIIIGLNIFWNLIVPLILCNKAIKMYYVSINRKINRQFYGEKYVEDLIPIKQRYIRYYKGTLSKWIIIAVVISSTVILGGVCIKAEEYLSDIWLKSLGIDKIDDTYLKDDLMKEENNSDGNVVYNDLLDENSDLDDSNTDTVDENKINDTNSGYSTYPSEGYYNVKVYVDGNEYSDDTNDTCVLMLTKKDGEEYTYTTDFNMGRPTVISINSNGTCNIVQDTLESNVGSWSRDNGTYTFITEYYTLQLEYLFSLGNTTKSIGNMHYFNYTYNDYNDLCEFQFVAPSFLVQSYTSLVNYVDFVNIANDDFGMFIETLSNPDNYSFEEMLNKCIEDYGNVSYKLIKDNYFIISGLSGNEIYYCKFYVLPYAIVSIQMTYPSQFKDLYSNVVSEIANGFIVY